MDLPDDVSTYALGEERLSMVRDWAADIPLATANGAVPQDAFRFEVDLGGRLVPYEVVINEVVEGELGRRHFWRKSLRGRLSRLGRRLGWPEQ